MSEGWNDPLASLSLGLTSVERDSVSLLSAGSERSVPDTQRAIETLLRFLTAAGVGCALVRAHPIPASHHGLDADPRRSKFAP